MIKRAKIHVNRLGQCIYSWTAPKEKEKEKMTPRKNVTMACDWNKNMTAKYDWAFPSYVLICSLQRYTTLLSTLYDTIGKCDYRI